MTREPGATSPRSRLRSLFDGERQRECSVCLHTWGRFPFEFVGATEAWDTGDTARYTDVYRRFLTRFPCDWLHVCEGPPRGLAQQSQIPAHLSAPLTCADVDAWIDGNVDGATHSADEFAAARMYDHVAELALDPGPDVMVFPNQGAPGSGFPCSSWEDQMVLAQQDPGLVRHYVARDCDRFLARIAAAGRLGADGYILSEGYGGACDLLSPALFRRIFLAPKRRMYAEIRRLGMIGIGYFLGGIEPYLDTISEMEADGAMVEETKKGFALDPVRIRRNLAPEAVLFGNLDSTLLLYGSPHQVREAVWRQREACAYGSFVLANGSPLCPGTPAANIDAFLTAARAP